MASAVEADLKQLRLVLAVFERRDRTVRTDGIFEELSERLREELDYCREAKHMRLYGEMLAGEPGVTLPEPLDPLSTDRLLTMTWVDGRRCWRPWTCPWRRATGWPRPCSAPGMCPSTNMA